MAAHEHRVVEVREGLISRKISGDRLEGRLTENGRDRRQPRAITSVEVERRVGPGAPDGLLATFERTRG